jgi:hypothetical protein
VIESDIPAQMLQGLAKLGVTGLAVLSDGLRRPISVERPLLGPGDWSGITFATFRSVGQAAAIQALGAQPVDVFGAALDKGLDSGEIQGLEKNLLIYQASALWGKAPYMTANVTLWPQTVVLLANPDRFAGLSRDQQGWLEQAAQDTAADSTSLFENEDQLVTDLCRTGIRLANASEADLAALRQAFDPVYTTLEQDPQTQSFIQGIEELKGSTPAGTPLAIPAGCSGSASQGRTTNDPIAGSWTTAKILESQIVRAFVALGGSEQEGHSFFASFGTGSRNYAVFTLRFKEGSWEASETGGDSPIHEDSGPYEIRNDGTFILTSGSCTDTVEYDLTGDTLLLHFVTQCAAENGTPYGPTYLGSFPFTRSG